MKEEVHIFQGLRRDNHLIKQKAEYLWDAHNVRLTNRDNSTLLSLTNEKGTLDTGITFKEYYVGHCVLGKYLIIFTATKDTGHSYIYRVENNEGEYKVITLYEGNINLNPNNPIESIGIYETELILKVYWVDGINLPRVINIVKPELKIENTDKYIINGVNFSGPIYHEDTTINNELKELFPKGLYLSNSFDFSRTLQLKEIVEVSKIYELGLFSPGVIQYAFSYYDKYGLESNICYTTPLYYISPKDRGGSPEEKVACSFNIKIKYPDTNFEYIRLYSIHRTSIDAQPTVKIVEDILIYPNENDELFYIDTGTTGSTIEPSLLLYVGGESLVSKCIAHKDGTLFLGNISQESNNKFKRIKEILLGDWEFDDWIISNPINTKETGSVYYDYVPNLGGLYSGAFKCGETYRCGLQVLYDNGKWSEPIFVSDHILNTLHVWDSYPNKESKSIRILNSDVDNPLHKSLIDLGVRRIRTCVVFPKTYERNIICQGILCPTVYNIGLRKTDSPYAMSSWFFRPATDSLNTNTEDVYHGASILFLHNYSLFTGENRGAEIQNMLSGATILNDITSTNVDKYSSHFLIDENIVTFHSPDIEFDPNLANLDYQGTKLSIVGIAKLGAISGDIDIKVSSPPAETNAPGFEHHFIGYQTKSTKKQNGGLIAGPLFRDYALLKDDKDNFTIKPDSDSYWMVYPWHRLGSLNNDSRRPADKGTRTAVLFEKKISNLKFFDRNESIDTVLNYNISTPLLFSSNETSIVKVTPAYLKKAIPYMGNVDTLLITKDKYPLYKATTSFSTLILSAEEGIIKDTSDPVRIKYKSSPHLVFSLGDSDSEIPLLPRHSFIGNTLNGEFQFPNWQLTGSSDGSNNDLGKYDYLLLHSYSDLHPPKNDIDWYPNACAICGNVNTGIYTLQRVIKEANGNVFLLTLNENNLAIEHPILKIQADFTTIGKSGYTFTNTTLLPGTTEQDYIGNVYKGSSKYYRVDFILDETPPTFRKCRLVDVTNEIITTIKQATGEGNTVYNLSLLSFGELNDTSGGMPYVLIGELTRIVNPNTKFGGKSLDALLLNLWIPSSDPIDIDTTERDLIIPFEYGDTWYSRYDCLKTYPFTQKDENSVIEIGSFMCETRVNIDGRYDKNRGQISNLNMSPLNFNFINEVYSQKDNFFKYRILDEDYYKLAKFATQVTWSKEKLKGEDIDTWTNITLANTLDMNGDKGEVTSIRVFNDTLICFQQKAISIIKFNSRVLIPTSDGVPIEITNGYKVDGNLFINDNVGCQNKWSIINTVNGIYFIDNYTDSIWVYNGKLANLSETLGLKWWLLDNHTNNEWKPVNSDNINGIRTFYDPLFRDVYFSPGPASSERDALCFSELLNLFVSLMSYGGVLAMFLFNDIFLSLKDSNGELKLYENFKGSYNNFFGNIKGWDFTFISNDNPLYTKIFDTIELRTDHWWPNGYPSLLNTFPMNYINVSNEYLDAYTDINSKNVRKKFRIWRGLIPRSVRVNLSGLDITRMLGRARIRNPWAMIKLGWNPDKVEQTYKSNKAIIHDVTVKYTI